MKNIFDHKMKLNKEPFEAILNGKKTIELRLYDKKRQKICIGDEIKFWCKETNESIYTTVKDIIVADDFSSLFKMVDLSKCGFEENIDLESAVKLMEEYYSGEEQARHKVVAIELEEMPEYDFSMFMPSKTANSEDTEEFSDDVDDIEMGDPGSIFAKLRANSEKEGNDDFSYEDTNTLSPLLYTLCFIVSSLCVALFFQTSVFTHILGLSNAVSKVAFCTLFFALILIGYIKTFEDNRTILNSVLIPCLPVGIYTVITYFRFYPIVMGIVIAISAGILIWLIVRNIIIPFKEHSFITFYVDELIVSSFKYVGCVMAVLIVMMAWLPSFGLPEIKTEVEKIPDSSFEDVYSISDKKDELSKYTGDNWSGLSVQERVDFLQHIANAEKRYLGLPFSVEVKAEVLDNKVLAEYSHEDHMIEMDYESLKSCKLEEAIESLAHECRHAYQRALVELYKSSDSKYNELYVFRYVPNFIEEFDNYIDAANDYEGYIKQWVEIDANAYAENATEDILETLGVE